MIEYKLGNRYAKSIISLAGERGELEKVAADFIKVREICNASPDFTSMLKSPLIFAAKKKKIIELVLGDNLTELTSSFIDILLRKKREFYLKDIAVCFGLQYDILKMNTRAVVTSANPLTEPQKAIIKSLVEKELGTTLFLEEVVDPSIIGGMILKVGDLLFDGSLSSKIRKLNIEFEKNPYVRLH